MKGFKNYTKRDLWHPENVLELMRMVVENVKRAPELVRYECFEHDARLALYAADNMEELRERWKAIHSQERVADFLDDLLFYKSEINKHIRPHYF